MEENRTNEYFRKINYYETDRMGITHHSNYIRFMEEARIDFLERIGCGYDKWEKEGILSPVTGLECKYKRPTTFGDGLKIRVAIKEYRHVRLSVSYTMVNAETGEPVFEGVSHHCFVNAEGKPVALSRKYPAFDALLKNQMTEQETVREDCDTDGNKENTGRSKETV